MMQEFTNPFYSVQSLLQRLYRRRTASERTVVTDLQLVLAAMIVAKKAYRMKIAAILYAKI